MLVAGGEGTLVGPLLGVALLTLLPTLFQPFALYKTFAEGALLVLCFLWLPEGMFGGRRLDRARSRGAESQPRAEPVAGTGPR